MITGIRLRDFKNFRDTRLSVGRFTVIVGTNASGKSNIRDAFRFLHGIGRGYTLPDIIGGKYGVGGQVEWPQMRGAANEIVRFQKIRFDITVDFSAEDCVGQYSIGVARDPTSRGGFKVVSEILSKNQKVIFDTRAASIIGPNARQVIARSETLTIANRRTTFPSPDLVQSDQPALSQLQNFSKGFPHQRAAWADGLMGQLAGIRFLDLVPEQMRRPAFPGQNVLGDSGENLPTVLQAICTDTARKSVLMDWIRELTPMDVTDFEFPTDPTTGLVQLALREANGTVISAYSASDGTLRFLAMLAALLGDHPYRMYFLEEIDNGIHPARLRLLLDLIERQTQKGTVQVVTTTHSPDLLSMISDDTFASTSVVYRSPDANEAIITPVADLPNAAALRASQGLGRLHAAGWMEDVLTLSDPVSTDG